MGGHLPSRVRRVAPCPTPAENDVDCNVPFGIPASILNLPLSRFHLDTAIRGALA